MRNFILICLICALLASCMSEKKYRSKYPCTGTVTFKIHRDTTYIPSVIETRIPPDSAWLQALIVCDSTGKAYIREIQKLKMGKNTVPFVHIDKGNILVAGAKVDSFAVYTAYKKQYIHETDQETITLAPVQVKFVPKFIQFLAWSGAALWLFVIVFFGIKLFNLVKKVWPI